MYLLYRDARSTPGNTPGYFLPTRRQISTELHTSLPPLARRGRTILYATTAIHPLPSHSGSGRSDRCSSPDALEETGDVPVVRIYRLCKRHTVLDGDG